MKDEIASLSLQLAEQATLKSDGAQVASGDTGMIGEKIEEIHKGRMEVIQADTHAFELVAAMKEKSLSQLTKRNREKMEACIENLRLLNQNKHLADLVRQKQHTIDTQHSQLAINAENSSESYQLLMEAEKEMEALNAKA